MALPSRVQVPREVADNQPKIATEDKASGFTTAEDDRLCDRQPEPVPSLESCRLAFLVALLILVLLVLLNSSADDLGSYFLLLPVIVLITCRSWYSMPRGRRPTVPPSGGKLPPRLAGPGRPATRLLTPGTRLMTTGLAAPSLELPRPATGG